MGWVERELESMKTENELAMDTAAESKSHLQGASSVNISSPKRVLTVPSALFMNTIF